MSIAVATIDDVRQAVDDALARQSGVHRTAWTVPEVATSLGTSPDTVRRLIKAGHLPLVPHMGARQLVPVVALEQFVSAGSPSADASPPGSDGTAAASTASVSPLQRPQAADRGAESKSDRTGGTHHPAA